MTHSPLSPSPALWLPCTQMQRLAHQPPLHIERARGIYLYDTDGRPYLDAISSWWVNLHGHCHPYINQCIKSQLDTLEHTLLASVVHPSIIKLAEKLVTVSPQGLTKAFFADSGSAAIECALKMSLQSWHQRGQQDKNTFVSLEHGYHGETLGSLAVTDIPLFSKQYAPLLIQHLRTPSPADIFRPAHQSQSDHEANCLAELEALFAQRHHEICAFILEPLVQGACGMGMYSAAYLQAARQLCDQYDIHLIADEIAVGFGRTGALFACNHADISPDFMCLSKGLTAGYLPMSCVLTTETIYHAFLDDSLERGFLHSHSFTGNPLAATAALASLHLFETKHTLTANERLIQHIASCLATLKETNLHTTMHRQSGMIAAFTIKHDQRIGQQLHAHALTQGILIRPIGNHVYIMPPYCISIEEIDQLFSQLSDAIHYLIDRANSLPSPTTKTQQYHQMDASLDPSLLS